MREKDVALDGAEIGGVWGVVVIIEAGSEREVRCESLVKLVLPGIDTTDLVRTPSLLLVMHARANGLVCGSVRESPTNNVRNKKLDLRLRKPFQRRMAEQRVLCSGMFLQWFIVS